MAPSSRRVAVLGATGQLGSDLCRIAREDGVEVSALGHQGIELTDAASVRTALEAARAEVVINSAAFHQLDRCEDRPEEALAVNALGALNVARSAKELGMRCVYVSTDYVFAGDKPHAGNGRVTPSNGYLEDDAPRPINVYGASKLTGEFLTQAATTEALVVRVSSLFGTAGARGKGGNFIEAILRKAQLGEPVSVVSDQHMTPTYTVHAARAILHLALSDRGGVVHVTNPEACSWYAFARAALELLGVGAEIRPIATSDYPSVARRPLNSALCTDMLTALLGAPLPHWRDALRAYLVEKGRISPSGASAQS